MYAELVFKHLNVEWCSSETMEPHVPRIRTPPYLSNTPDVYYHSFCTFGTTGTPSQRALILCSDGLTDLYDGYTTQEMADEWAQLIGRELAARSGSSPGDSSANLALQDLSSAAARSNTR